VLEITVKDEHGQLFAGAEVAIAPSGGDDHGDASRRAKTNSRGVVRFSGLRPASYVISAAGAGTASVAVLPGETTTFELSMRR
jgi:protocatechuate 3,4-dioxygenase beta subunit